MGCAHACCRVAWAEYMRVYRAENRDVVNARQRARRKAKRLHARGESVSLEALFEDELRRSIHDEG